MAVEILSTYVAHDVRHDLESFFWLLIWVVLRYTETTCWPLYEEYIFLFGCQTEKQSEAAKRTFLTKPILWKVVNNAPLTDLVMKYKRLCRWALPELDEPTSKPEPLTYENVVALFDEALARPDWPQNDHAIPFKMPSKAHPTEDGSQPASGSRGGSKRPAYEPDPLSLPPHKRMHIYRPPTEGEAVGGDDQEDADGN